MKKFWGTFFLAFTLFCAKAQVGINILIPDSSAALQLESTQKGLGLTRLTTTQRDAIYQPLKGLTIYNTTDSLIEYWNGECWLKVYEKNCYECAFNISIDDATDTLDRLVADSVFSTITVQQTHGNQNITVIQIASVPAGINVHFNGNPVIDSTGTLQIVVSADKCAPVGGTFPIIIQAFCDNVIHFTTYTVTIPAPQLITIPIDQMNYDLQAVNNLPTTTPQFIVLNVNSGVTLTSATTTSPAYTSGSLSPNSLVCITNNGSILGRGGDGGSFNFNGNLFVVGGDPGQPGGNAMNLTTRTVLQNYGDIYGGGSGGGSVGFAVGTPSIPVIGSIVIGFGFCGGGGSELGRGGTTNPGGVTIGMFRSADSATCCINSVPGLGPQANYPISIPISVASVNITPTAYGGNGGGFGQQGTRGFIDVTVDVCVNIPIIGNICIPIPINQLLGGLLPYYGPASGIPGRAIKRNNNALVGVADGTYYSTQIKGRVTP